MSTNWTEKDVRHARGILMNVPDLPRTEFLRKRRIELLKFVGWLGVTVALGLINPILWFVGFVLGWFIVDPGSFKTYENASNMIKWAKQVQEDVGEGEGKALQGDVDESLDR